MADLTAERLREILHYNPETGVFTWRVSKGRRIVAGAIAGCVSERGKNGYIRVAIERRRYYAHHLAWLYIHGKWANGRIDHINTDKLDNRIANLREATPAENTQNQHRAHSQNKTGLLGVSATRGNRYVAEIKVNGKRIYLGRYATPEDAHAAYLREKQRVHPFGTLNESELVSTRLIKTNKTGFIGVQLRSSGRYSAEFGGGSRKVRLGLFDTAEEASQAYLKAKAGLHKRKKPEEPP